MTGRTQQEFGNFGVVRGALYGQRQARDRRGPRRHEPPDLRLDREIQDVFTNWKGDAGEGAYASRGIADAAHGLTHPARVIGRRMREARDGGVGHERVRRLGQLLLEYADRIFGKSA